MEGLKLKLTISPDVFDDIDRLKRNKGFEGKKSTGKEMAEEAPEKKYIKLIDNALKA